MTTCMFTGHRPQKLPFKFNEQDRRCIALKEYLAELIVEKVRSGITHFLSGMALGTDLYSAEIVLSFKNQFSGFTLDAVLPCSDQTSKWNEEQARRHHEILKKCDKVLLLQDAYTSDCMQKRNRYMVDHSDCVIAVWNGTVSGTGQTVKYALSRKLPVTVLDPRSLTVQTL